MRMAKITQNNSTYGYYPDEGAHRSSETFVTLYQRQWQRISEDNDLHIHTPKKTSHLAYTFSGSLRQLTLAPFLP
jgi:hypothetical protein